MKKKDGAVFPVEVTAGRFVAKGRLKLMATIRDITEKKALEEQLLQSQKIEAIGRLAGGIAHDFNNLLVGILGYSDLLLEELEGNDKCKNYVREIEKAGQRAAELTRQLLAFSRKQVFQPKILDMNSLVRGMEKMLRRLLGEDIEHIYFASDSISAIKADPGQIEQVIMNLALNARDAMPNGGKLIFSTGNVVLDENSSKGFISDTSGTYGKRGQYGKAIFHTKPGQYVMLSISDNG